MPNPTFAIVVTFEIKPEHVDSFRQRVIQQASDSIDREPGCCQFDVLEDEAHPGIIVLYETYVDAQEFVKHKQTSHFHDFDLTVAPWIAHKQVKRLTMLKENRRN